MALVSKKISLGPRIVKIYIEKQKEKESNISSQGKFLNPFLYSNLFNRSTSEEIFCQIIIFNGPCLTYDDFMNLYISDI
jgi:hypothetical protein